MYRQWSHAHSNDCPATFSFPCRSTTCRYFVSSAWRRIFALFILRYANSVAITGRLDLRFHVFRDDGKNGMPWACCPLHLIIYRHERCSSLLKKYIVYFNIWQCRHWNIGARQHDLMPLRKYLSEQKYRTDVMKWRHYSFLENIGSAVYSSDNIPIAYAGDIRLLSTISRGTRNTFMEIHLGKAMKSAIPIAFLMQRISCSRCWNHFTTRLRFITDIVMLKLSERNAFKRRWQKSTI